MYTQTAVHNLAPARVTEGRGTFQLTTMVQQFDGPVRIHALGRNVESYFPKHVTTGANEYRNVADPGFDPGTFGL